MRLLVSWVRDFVDVTASPQEIAEALALRGFEVASIEPLAAGDAVIDFEVTANRPDCLSVIGLAREVATAYLKYLYSPEGQEIAAHNFYRPRDGAFLSKYASQFPTLKLFTVKDLFGGWAAAQKKHFSDGGIFDQIYGKPNTSPTK